MVESGDKSVTCTAPINIALIKYWGKSNEDYNLPLNPSLSVTLHPQDLCTKSTVYVSPTFASDKMWLNGKEQGIENNKRTQRCLKEARRSSLKRGNEAEISSPSKCHIVTENNFPTAAGLASSASGYACLAKCLGTIYSPNMDLSVLARLGSGSACRSMYGGFVKWEKGTCATGSDSKAVQVAPETHWPELRVIILVVSNKQKSVGSTEGMRRSVHTSELLKYRVEKCVPERIKILEKAILEKDFETFALLTMKESNQLHCICQDTYPPISPPYMNSVSHQIVQLVTSFNENGIKVAYTFDAGPNAVLFTLEEHADLLLGTVLKQFPIEGQDYEDFINMSSGKLENIKNDGFVIDRLRQNVGALERIICTTPGPGASVNGDSLPLPK